jgi:hypothetical protein
MNSMASLKSSASSPIQKMLFLSVALALIFALGVTPAQAAATTDITNISEQVDLLVYVPCAAGGAGELVDLSGPLHMLFVTVFDGQGNFHTKTLFQPQGISGTGETTGAMYHATGETQDSFNGKLGYEYTYVNNFKIIGEGTGNNFLVHENIHLTVNANGTLTAYVDNFSAECR